MQLTGQTSGWSVLDQFPNKTDPGIGPRLTLQTHGNPQPVSVLVPVKGQCGVFTLCGKTSDLLLRSLRITDVLSNSIKVGQD
jgi:hypothetical protein